MVNEFSPGTKPVAFPEIEMNIQGMEYTVHLESEGKEGRRDLKECEVPATNIHMRYTVQPDSPHLKS